MVWLFAFLLLFVTSWARWECPQERTNNGRSLTCVFNVSLPVPHPCVGVCEKTTLYKWLSLALLRTIPVAFVIKASE